VKNPTVYYAAIALGVIIALAGIFMLVGMHFHGKAYAAIAVGAIILIAGIAGMFVAKPSAAK
jgi:NADH:ubiquinone oxidoreductase subunit 6 (subunit J)